MNRLLCALTGGHRWEDAAMRAEGEIMVITFEYRECARCGAVTE